MGTKEGGNPTSRGKQLQYQSVGKLRQRSHDARSTFSYFPAPAAPKVLSYHHVPEAPCPAHGAATGYVLITD